MTFLKFHSLSRSPRPTVAPQHPEPPSPGGWGYGFQNLPSTHIDTPFIAPIIPPLPSKLKKALSNMSGTSGSSKYTTPPTQLPTRTTGAGSRNKRPQSTATPPFQAGKLLAPIYVPIRLTPGTGRTVPVSVPTQPQPGMVAEPLTPMTTASMRDRGSADRRNGKRR